MSSYSQPQQKPKTRKQHDADMRLKNNRLGMTLFQGSWMMAFVAMVIVNWQLRFSYAQWPPLGIAPFDPLLPSLATLALICSALLVQRALQTLRGGGLAAFLNHWRLALALALGFLLIIAYEFLTVSQAALATQYGLTFRLMSGFHFVHALVIAAIMLKVYRQGARGGYSGSEHDSWAVEASAKLWYFVTFAWLLFYVVLYWIR